MLNYLLLNPSLTDLYITIAGKSPSNIFELKLLVVTLVPLSGGQREPYDFF